VSALCALGLRTAVLNLRHLAIAPALAAPRGTPVGQPSRSTQASVIKEPSKKEPHQESEHHKEDNDRAGNIAHDRLTSSEGMRVYRLWPREQTGGPAPGSSPTLNPLADDYKLC
jgi:hypothetical protein